MITLQRELFGCPIRCQAQRLDEGVHVLLTGGCKTHIGAVSVASPGREPETMTFPGHKDQLVSEPWARTLAEETGQRAAVACGIHYDHAGAEEIAQILRCTEDLLAQLIRQI